MTAAERQARYSAGLRSEWIAALALRLRGYRILAKRWKSSAGEIDIVAARGKRLAFIRGQTSHRRDRRRSARRRQPRAAPSRPPRR